MYMFYKEYSQICQSILEELMEKHLLLILRNAFSDESKDI